MSKIDDSDWSFSSRSSVYETSNTMMAAAMLTLGIPMKAVSGGNIIVGNGITAPGGAIVWRFEECSEDGKYTATEIKNKWNNVAWLTDPANEDILAYITCAFHNYKRLIEHLKEETPMVLVAKGNRKALVRANGDKHWEGIAERFLDRR